MTADPKALVERFEAYVSAYADAPSWGGPTLWPKPPSVEDIKLAADLITRLAAQLAEAEAEVGRLKAELDGISSSIPDDLAQHLVMLGEAEWGQTDPKDAEGHAASVANSIYKTAIHFGQTGDQPMQGLWIKDEPILLCHTGTGPNSAKTARCLTAAWNFMLGEARQALASEPGK